MERIGNELHFSLLVTQPAGSDLIVDIETSTTLENAPEAWTILASRSGNGPWMGAPTEATPVRNGIERITLIVPVVGEQRRFYRASARLTP